MNEEIKQRIQKRENWQRGLFMLFFMFIYGFSNSLVIGILFFQFATLILTGKTNEFLLGFSQRLSIYIHQIINFLTFNSEQRPFPFSTWPNASDTLDMIKDSSDSSRND
ncbi:DUF4389 domain-containing protein [Nitrosomonas sp. Is35]|uniref:DUF4389 domain-containing protein n=1 Tax=Nitrosomonas sp. Is35 TaxID=3080534 RepID=UPI00294A9F4F|nr:DUF4389 domain-containing protein [Nitrosomonas sp. Is35]MDV6348059.1 DUF4389 domain-containing protein [Nitrosomonas sp. Is35]